jgi:hypothetical protein
LRRSDSGKKRSQVHRGKVLKDAVA